MNEWKGIKIMRKQMNTYGIGKDECKVCNIRMTKIDNLIRHNETDHEVWRNLSKCEIKIYVKCAK